MLTAVSSELKIFAAVIAKLPCPPAVIGVKNSVATIGSVYVTSQSFSSLRALSVCSYVSAAISSSVRALPSSPIMKGSLGNQRSAPSVIESPSGMVGNSSDCWYHLHCMRLSMTPRLSLGSTVIS